MFKGYFKNCESLRGFSEVSQKTNLYCILSGQYDGCEYFCGIQHYSYVNYNLNHLLKLVKFFNFNPLFSF
jgi:hypothetical protein